MKFAILISLFSAIFTSTNLQARNLGPMTEAENNCALHVAQNLLKFSNCGDTGTGKVEYCTRPAVHNGNYLCLVDHEVYRSSSCLVLIEMDEDCYRNLRASIVNDNREDI